MKKVLFFLFAVSAAIFIMASDGWTFRCGLELVTTGNKKFHVLTACGEPTYKEKICIEHHRETGVCVNSGEAWYYNCGDSDFLYSLTFNEDGTLIKEDTAGRGKGMSDCGGRLSR